MGMTPQRLLCTLKGSGSGSIRSTRSCVLIQESSLIEVLYTMSLYMHNMLLRRLSIRHMRNK